MSKRLILSTFAALSLCAVASTAVLARSGADETVACASPASVVTEADLMAELAFHAELEALSDPATLDELALAAANWTWSGCIQLGSTCYDVYSDQNGTLWVCKACGTTGNPSPGKCRKLTAYEIANSLWCA
jgi:hypothetical protein